MSLLGENTIPSCDVVLVPLVTFRLRVIFRRGRECDGEAYIMFTGTADQKGGDKSGDRLIK